MTNGVNDYVLILTETFSCTISVSAEEITIKKPSNEQQTIEQLIIQAEQRAYQEALVEYKHKSSISNFICNIPGFEDTFQQKLDTYMAQHDIVKVPEKDLPLLSLVSPFTSSLNINTPMLYKTTQYCIVYARGTQSGQNSSNAAKISSFAGSPNDLKNNNQHLSSNISNSVTEAFDAYHYYPTNISGLFINNGGISFNINSAFNIWSKATIKH
ncbi:hypothetical protein FH508_0021975 [Lysinibacillus sp. CD3-6]|uniref:hypothetical protein n=1 Tax=Lysinibacillus sp. CD3-6 TaxID=2892541 RepID=UPI00111ED28E|nr:hypothetical protein [Lysinibacillus sp. CD3-6]UED80002.1 hypothetical protein FH508_0021975 [Lysinibacillus sp. CD3-6]